MFKISNVYLKYVENMFKICSIFLGSKGGCRLILPLVRCGARRSDSVYDADYVESQDNCKRVKIRTAVGGNPSTSPNQRKDKPPNANGGFFNMLLGSKRVY